MNTSPRLKEKDYKPKRAPEPGRGVQSTGPAASTTTSSEWGPHVAKHADITTNHQSRNEKTGEPANKREGGRDRGPGGPPKPGHQPTCLGPTRGRR